jgi:DNA ligase (NAD+)
MKASEYLIRLKEISYNDLIKVDGFADKTVKSVMEYANSEEFEHLLQKLRKLEAEDKGLEVKLNDFNTKLDTKLVCITGTFDIPRTEIVSQLESKGYKVTNTFTTKIDILLAGEKAGSKLNKAKKLNIKIIEDYKELI